MQLVNGVYLPDGDTHFAEFFSRGSDRQYQGEKIAAGVRACKQDRRRLALDIGAHVGLWSRPLADAFDSLRAFEPVPEHCECWEANMRGVDNATLHPVALAKVSGSLAFEPAGANSGNWRVGDGTGRLQFQAFTLDEFGFQDVDFIKIDAEGYEYNILLGGEATIRKQRPVVVVEQKPGHGRRYGEGDRAAVQLLENWGAHVLWSKAGDYCLGW